MKKTVYIAPAIKIAESGLENMICASVTAVGGNAGIELGEGDTPTTADTRRMTQWEDDEE